jgi:MEMO1 family protein
MPYVRPAAVAGTWYPGTPGALDREVRDYLAQAPATAPGLVRALIAPHAGIMFSGPVAAHAYHAVAGASYDTVVLVGPSHFVGFEGLALVPDGVFDTPLGPARIDARMAAALEQFPVVHVDAGPHRREHALEMQLPFLRTVLPEAAIVPLLMGYQTGETIEATAAALAAALDGRNALLVASTDLSHYFDAATAGTLDGRVVSAVASLDVAGLRRIFEEYPDSERGRFVACGGGPAIAVLAAAQRLGATGAQVLKYGHSGEVSGDYDGVVGYLAAAIGDW